MSIESDLVASLNPLVNNRVFPGFVPLEDQIRNVWPILVTSTAFVDPNNTACGSSDSEGYRVQVDIYARSYVELLALRPQVFDAIELKFDAAERISDFDGEYDEQLKLYRRTIEYSIFLNHSTGVHTMSKGKTTPFKGSKLYIQSGISDSTLPVSAISLTNPATATITGATYAKGDVVVLSGLSDELDGAYVVSGASDSSGMTQLSADFTEYDAPDDYASAEAALVEFGTNFCEVTAINKTGGTIDQNEVSTICSTRKEYDPGLPDAGTLQLSFNYAPAVVTQQLLMDYEVNVDKFWVKLVLPRAQGTLLYYGSIQTGANMDGSVGGVYTSGVTIQLSGDYYHIPVGA